MLRKTYLRMAAAVALLAGAASANAQVTSLSVTGDMYSQSYCATPAQAYYYIMGNVSGTAAPNDSLTVYVNFNDGQDTTFKIPVSPWGGMVDSVYAYGTHTYDLAGTYTPTVTVTAPSSVSSSANMNTVTFTNTCGNITGTTYVDADGDCTYDVGEVLLEGYVTATNTTTSEIYWGYCYNGVYSIAVPSGATYTVNGNTSYWWTGIAASCPASGSATVAVSGTGTYTQNFGFSCSATGLDLSVGAWAFNFRPGYTRPLSIGGYSNNFCTNSPATVTVTLPSTLSYSSTSYGPAPTVSGNTLTWNVSSLDAFNSFYSYLQIYCDPSVAIGDSACLTVTITPTSGTETNTANNTYNFCVPINNSMDPNDKAASPRGMGSEGYTDAQIDGLTYLVNFQNTGNDVAYNVTIADKLDADIDPASIYVVGASHPYTTTIANGNELKFRFSGINLAASSVNEPASHGWVMYRARIKDASHQPGTVINNTADIYFDYNAAIVTNTTTNTLMTAMGVQHLSQGRLEATVAPNPADGALTVSIKDGKPATATLLDMTGRTVAQQENGTGRMELATKALPAGMYLLQVRSGNTVLSTKVTVQH